METHPEPRRAAMRRFNARPLVLCAAGVSFGVLLAYRLQGTPAIVAACLFLAAAHALCSGAALRQAFFCFPSVQAHFACSLRSLCLPPKARAC